MIFLKYLELSLRNWITLRVSVNTNSQILDWDVEIYFKLEH